MVRLAFFEVNNYGHIYIPPPFILLQTSVQPTAKFSCTIEFFLTVPSMASREVSVAFLEPPA